MAVRRKRKVRTVSRQEVIDATPERIAKDQSEFVNPATIDSSEQNIGLTRRFRASHIDRLYKNGRLTDRQWAAGDWYRDQHARGRFALAVVASYGERTSAGEPAYGLPRTEAQARARQLYRQARDAFPVAMVGFMDRLLVHDELPKYGGRAAYRNLMAIGSALDRLADWLKYPEGR
jgi:hypothetical protein